VHEEPKGVVDIARHYIRDVVYGANDGLITTFAVVAGVTGGALSPSAVLIVGAANLFADGLSMGVGNYLAIRSHESALAAQNKPEEESSPIRHGFATVLAFVAAGAVPLAPFVGVVADGHRFAVSVALTFATLFGVGAMRATVTMDRWWVAGLEMLLLGIIVAGAAYGSGAAVAWMIASGGPPVS
jgi:VIT1/CCC1 family predicted Fe2+/Mn2+ transporter